jgi:hypothetical protein
VRLPGRLRATTLGDLLGKLFRERASGVLELVEPSGPSAGRRHLIWLLDGLVADVDSSFGVLRIGEILRREGFLGDDGLRRLLRRLVERPDRRSGELLLDEELVEKDALRAALRHQLRARLDALFGLADALLSFHVARRRPAGSGQVVPLSPFEFLHGRRRFRERAAACDAARPPEPPTAATARVEAARTRALATLGLDTEADRDAVQRAFRQIALRLHPDRHQDKSSMEKAVLMRRFAQVSAAYHLLVA